MFLTLQSHFQICSQAEDRVSYCRWLEGDLYAYRASHNYRVHVAARCVNDEVDAHYVEASAAALLGRMLWLWAKGCDYPWYALRHLRDDIIEGIEKGEVARREAIKPPL